MTPIDHIYDRAMELRHLRYLLAVAEHGSFTRAAEALHLSQPTLSHQVRQLERSLGVELLDRTGRRVRPTDAGEAYLRHARLALRELATAERAVQDVQDLSRGTLRLATTPTFSAYLTGPLVAAFHAAHPGIVLDVREVPQDRIEAELAEDALDLGIAFGGTHRPGIAAQPLFPEGLVLAVGPAHPLAGRREPLPAAELAGHPLALLSGGFATRRHLDAYAAENGLALAAAVEAASIAVIADLVAAGALASVLPDRAVRQYPDLSEVPTDPPLPTRTVVLLHRESAYRSAALRAFTAAALAHVPSGGDPAG
ncbi:MULTISPECIES: transcriptional regulator CynR [Kitasatospora]|uniref:Transcriptional regulator CynR n=1 Tax=Kitasatospora arboriphila TaxID=258052 RepID=A0ABN1TCW2_9ACTN